MQDHATPQQASPPAEQGVFANRTLNLRSVPAIGYDMDYTLIHYRVDEWEGEAFGNARSILVERGWPLADLDFDPQRFILGLVFDLQLGNLVKATRFGYVVRAQHGTDHLDFEGQRDLYRETEVELSSPRFRFMNTLFELSRAELFTQAVAIHDRSPLPGVTSYADLYEAVDEALSETHLTGRLKADILANPDRFVDPDPHLVRSLLDQRAAGKRLLLITNSDWAYTRRMMAWTLDPFCPGGSTWRDLFDLVIVSANKPGFFAKTDPVYRVVDEEESLLQPHHGPLEPGAVYHGGNARLVEASLERLGATGMPLYVGDHLFGDVHVTKDVLRWRTALIARELEDEIADALAFTGAEQRLQELMARKVELEQRQAQLRMARRRDRSSVPSAEISEVGAQLAHLDERIAPLARAASELGSPIWGPLMRAGNDKSLFARQVERYADVYTSRASNLRHPTPFGYLRAARGSLPHDAGTAPGRDGGSAGP